MAAGKEPEAKPGPPTAVGLVAINIEMCSYYPEIFFRHGKTPPHCERSSISATLRQNDANIRRSPSR